MADDRKTNGSSDHDFDMDYIRTHFPRPSSLKSPQKSPLKSPVKSPGQYLNPIFSPNLRIKNHISDSLESKVPDFKGQCENKDNKKDHKGTVWTPEEDRLLKSAANLYSCKNWKAIAKMVPGRTHSQCSQRWRRIQPYKIRQPWAKDEDKRLMELVSQYGQNWSLISSSIEGRTGKQVRERWLNKLNPAIDRSRFTTAEDDQIVALYKRLGPKWKEISKELKGRTENMVKNRFYSSIKKTLLINNPEVYKELFENEMKVEEIAVKVDKKRDLEDVLQKCENEAKNSMTLINMVGIQDQMTEILQDSIREDLHIPDYKMEFQDLHDENKEQKHVESKSEFLGECKCEIKCNHDEANNAKSPLKEEFKEIKKPKTENAEPLERINFLAKKKEFLEGLLMRVMGQIQEHNFLKTNDGL